MSSKELMVSGKPLSSLRVVDLKEELEKRGLSKSGSKKDLAERLKQRLLIENQRESQKNETNEDELPNMSMRNQLSEQNPFIQEYFQSQAELFHSQKVVKKLYEGMSHSSEEQQEQQNTTTEPPPSAPPPPPPAVEEKTPEEVKEPEKAPEVVKEEPEKEPVDVSQKEEEKEAIQPSSPPPPPEKITEQVSKTEEKEEIPETQQTTVQVEVTKSVPVAEKQPEEKEEIPNEKEKNERQSSPPPPVEPPPPQEVIKRQSPRKPEKEQKEQQQQQVVVEEVETKSTKKQVEQKEMEVEEEEEDEIQLKTSESEIEKLNEDITTSSKNKPQLQREEQVDEGSKSNHKLPVETSAAGSESSTEDVGLQIHKEESSSESEEEEESDEEEEEEKTSVQKQVEQKPSESEEEEEEIKMKAEESSEESESGEEGEAEEEDTEPPPAKKRLEEDSKKESNHDKVSISQESSESPLKQINKEITKITTTTTVDIAPSSVTTTSNVSTTIKRKRAIQSEDVEEEVLDYGDEDSKTKKETEEVSWNRRILRLKNRCAVVEKLDKKWNRGDRKPIVVTSKILQDFFPDVKLLADTELKLEEKPHVEPATVSNDKRIKESEDSAEVPMDQESESNLNQDNSSEPNVVNVKRKISIIPFEETVKELTPPLNQPSNYLMITNLVRPFTLLQLKEMLQRTGTIEDIWVDKIKSKCIAKFEKQEEAEETRAALHGIRWPSSNPKALIVDFTDETTFEDHRGRTKDTNNLITSHSNNNSAVDNKSNVKIEKPSGAKGTIPVREWDLGKRSRSRSRDRDRRRRSTSQERKRNRRSISPRHDKKSSRDIEAKEEATGKALDELFRKTITTPCIYWLPLTPEQIAEKEEMRRKRMIERERRIQEIEKASKQHIRPR